jgi:acyl-CoA thioesterase
MSPHQIVELMIKKDSFSQFLNIEVVKASLGFSVLKLQVHEGLLNGFHIAHGGVSFALADSCLAFAANSYGYKAVSIESSISHLKKVCLNDTLLVTSEEIRKGKSIGVYQVKVENQFLELVAHFKGTVHFLPDMW